MKFCNLLTSDTFASPSLQPRFSLAIAMLMSDYVSTLKVG